jgi:AhpD family alkylhydroperoxidase
MRVANARMQLKNISQRARTPESVSAQKISLIQLHAILPCRIFPSARNVPAVHQKGRRQANPDTRYNATRRNSMMIDWNEYQKQIGTTVAELAKLSPDTLRGYRALSDANAKDSKLGPKVRELISLAVAVTTHCDGCIVIHTEAALKAGASREEIAETLGVTVAMNAGAALVYSTRVLDAATAKTQAAHGD